MVKNISETIKVPASFLVDGFQDLSAEAKEKVILLSQKQAKAEAENKVVDASEVEEVAKLLPEKMKADLANVGAVLPSDQIALTMRMGDFIYHIFAFNSKPSQAPLAIKRHEKKLLDLADVLDKDELEIPEDVLKVVETVLEDEDKWKKTQFGALLKVSGDNKYIGLSAMGASIFRKVIESTAALFVETK